MLEPMLASLADAPLDDPNLVYEPKYDGIRAIAEVGRDSVRLWSRLGNEKTNQFPEIVAALEAWAKRLKAPVVLDGEIVALDAKGEPSGFQQLQGRIHVLDPAALAPPRPSRRSSRSSRSSPSSPSSPSRPSGPSGPSVAYIVFDLLRDGRTDLRDRPLVERRAALERLMKGTTTATLRLSQQVRGDARRLYDEALKRGWEGLIAKHASSLYKSGKRTPDWRKLKIVREQEFVVGGWTEPRNTRAYFGALLLGVYDDQAPGTINTQHPAPSTQHRQHPAPSTRHQKHPAPSTQHPAPSTQHPAPSTQHPLVYVGHIGTGFNEKELAKVMKLLQPLEIDESPFRERPKSNERPHWVKPELVAQVRFTEWTTDGRLRHPVYLGLRDDKRAADVHREERERVSKETKATKPARRGKESGGASGSIVEQLTELEKARKDGLLRLPDGETLAVTNLHKIFWPKLRLTKGDLFRYYARVAPMILPVLADRPLVMKRFPNGVAAKPFYQHRAPDVPAGIRTAEVRVAERRAHIVGGSLETLMYTTQLAAISQDPWFSRVEHPEFVDHAALDLDPSDEVPFRQVLDVARWIRDELASLGATGWAKTSGASGLHVYVPMPAQTPYDAGLLFCQIVATVVAQKHPKVATVERSVAARGKRVYVDFLQNILGKTLASAYSARASDYAGVSTPLSWKEVDDGVDRNDFTIATVPARLERVGDLWQGLRKSKGVDLERAARYITRK
jgi:bifunctional non-homologous end joining protein LigD